jgi:hypothetical protein
VAAFGFASQPEARNCKSAALAYNAEIMHPHKSWRNGLKEPRTDRLEREIRNIEMICRPIPRSVRRRLLAALAFVSALLLLVGSRTIFAPSAAAEDSSPLTQLAQLTVQKGFKNISLGDVCDRLRIGISCKAYQLNARIDSGESQKFGLPAGWQTALNVLPQLGGGANVVITDHDDHIGYGYLIGPDGDLKAVTVGLSSSGDGKNWRWKPTSITDEITQKFALEKAYWVAQIKDIRALPDRKD